MPSVTGVTLRILRVLSLLLLSSLSTVVLMRCAPGYFSDARELDAQHANTVREALGAERATGTLRAWTSFLRGAAHLDFGTSRQYSTPVWPLVRPRLQASLRLLVPSVLAGSVVAVLCATLLLTTRTAVPNAGLALTATVFCAVPVSVLTLVCLLSGRGGPATVLFLLVAARDFRVFSRFLRAQSQAPHLLYARAAGVGTLRILWRHLLLCMPRELAALLTASFLVGLNATLPVEVVFGVPGIGQLAWSAAMERDLPVLLAVTLMMALSVACMGVLQGQKAGVANA